jgi:glycosyltransferase involved in cell wall biosynthesis
MSGLAFFVPFSFGRGVERVNVTLAKAFAKLGHQVDVVAGRTKGPYFGELNGNTRVIDLEVGRTAASLLPLARYLRRERPSALLAAPDSGSVIALWARELAGVDTRVVTATHAVLSQSLSRKPNFYRRAFPHVLRNIYPRADATVAVSNWVADDLAEVARLPRSRIQVIPNPVVHEELLAQAREPIKHRWLTDRGGPLIISVGRLNEEKNYSDLVHAFARLRQQRQARLIILGEGAERGRLVRLARALGVAGDIDLPGFMKNPYAYMAQADLLALSSRYEALPTVIIEALACGCPVVAVDCPGGVREILQNGRYGRLVPPGNADLMVQAMLATLEEPPRPERLKERAADFHVDRTVARYRQVLGL